ncbi:achaete-scute homolog 4 [Ambystoma mexicanum]|uniref:achaete-scute homolog 4 n=1 Tax=Ambystoma mexicanum TaxID=8296 RepID=UPI0037E87025
MELDDADGLFSSIPPYQKAVPLGIPVEHYGLSVREPYGVTFHFSSPYYNQVYHGYSGHFSYLSLPAHVGLYDSSFEPAYIQKRNERERQRVRFVNEGYTRLRQHLPPELAETRLSKVETLRAAINYIRGLQGLLNVKPAGSSKKEAVLSKEKVFPPTFCLQSMSSSECESKTSSPLTPHNETEVACN